LVIAPIIILKIYSKIYGLEPVIFSV